MGEYAKNCMETILMASDKSSGKNSDDEADLFGSRMVCVSEPQDGCRLNESKVKRLVDTDTIRAMRKFEHSFEFQPTHKIWLQTNYKPKVQGDDEGIWRRIKLIPFLVQIPIEERDEHLDAKLQNEGSGILLWMLAGLRAWYAAGRKLNEPIEIRDAVGGYRSDSDAFGSFLSDCIEPNDVDRLVVADAYNAYVRWSDENGQKFKMTKMEFGKKMASRRYETRTSNGVRYFKGCRLKPMGESDELWGSGSPADEPKGVEDQRAF